MSRPAGRPSNKPKILYDSFPHQAQRCDKARRAAAKVESHCDELFPRVGFIVANTNWRSHNLVWFHNGRGAAEQWINEGKQAPTWTRLSCHDFRDNEARLQQFALAYNRANFLRTLALPRKVERWSLTTRREKVVKIGAKVVNHANYVVFHLEEVAIPRALFAMILEKIHRLRSAPGTG